MVGLTRMLVEGSGQSEGIEVLRINGDVAWLPKKKTMTKGVM